MKKSIKKIIALLLIIDFASYLLFTLVFGYFHIYKNQLNVSKVPVLSTINNPHTELIDSENNGLFYNKFKSLFSEKTTIANDTESIEKLLSDKDISKVLLNDDNSELIGIYQSNSVFLALYKYEYQYQSLKSGNPHPLLYYYYDFYIRDINNIYCKYSGERTEFYNLVAQQQYSKVIPIAAINGDYWGNTNHCMVSERNGGVLRVPSDNQFILSDIGVLYYDGTFETYLPEDFNYNSIINNNPYQIWDFGPALLDSDGNPYSYYSNQSYDHNVVSQRHPRSVIGYYEPGHYSFMIVDGRTDYSDGLTIYEVADIISKKGCKRAYNLDGGDSTYAWFDNVIIRQNLKRLSQGNARDIYDIVCVGEFEQ